jgi:serine/threonine protein kinase
MLLPNDPKEIGGIQILDRLGSGGAGIVYKGRDKDNEIVALKVLHAEFANNQTVRKRLEREADAMRSVKGNRTVKIRRIEIDVVQPFIVMDFAEGENLANYIANHGVLRGQALNDFALQLAEAIRDIHKAKVIHRDLKPTNVIIGPDGLKVVDFGISIISEVTGMTQTGLMVGTVSWLSPEQILGKEITQKTDIFNYGLVLGFAATGKHPFGEGKPEAVMFRILNSDPELNNIKNELRLEILEYLDKNPHNRLIAGDVYKKKNRVQTTISHKSNAIVRYKKIMISTAAITLVFVPVPYLIYQSNDTQDNLRTTSTEDSIKTSRIFPSPVTDSSQDALFYTTEPSIKPKTNELKEEDKTKIEGNENSNKGLVQNAGKICFEKTQEFKSTKKCKNVTNKEKFFNYYTPDEYDPFFGYSKIMMWSPWVGDPMCLKQEVRFTSFFEVNGFRPERRNDIATVVANPNSQSNDFCKNQFSSDFLDVTFPVYFDGDKKDDQVGILEMRSINENPIVIKATWTPSIS